MLEETEKTQSFFFVTFLSLATFQLGGEAAPHGYAYVLGSFVLEMRKLLATSEAEFKSSVGGWCGYGFETIQDESSGYFGFRE